MAKLRLIPALLITCAIANTNPAENLQHNTTSDSNTLKVYLAPSESSTVIANIDPNTGITVLPNNWVQVVDIKSNKTGWVTQEELKKALKQDNIWLKQVTTNASGNFKSVSEIKTGSVATNQDKTAADEYHSTIAEVKKQHEIMSNNFNQTLQQLRQLETDLFDDTMLNNNTDNWQSTNTQTTTKKTSWTDWNHWFRS
ncbi:MAG: SH3 domain-containing protein [Legionellales bacterium]|jgi:hypothetical protein|nr:SH3 domain-containing protein [Legionellales bacterium]